MILLLSFKRKAGWNTYKKKADPFGPAFSEAFNWHLTRYRHKLLNGRQHIHCPRVRL